MATPVFPQLIGMTWDQRKRPTWGTSIARTNAGNEFRTTSRLVPLTEFDLGFDYLSPTDKTTLEGFFNQQQGAFAPFYFNNTNDNSVTMFAFAQGNGTANVFTLTKPAGTGAVENVGGVNGAPLIYTTAYYNDVAGHGIENLVLDSQDITQAAWSKQTGVTATGNTTTAPDGTVTADTVAYNGTGVAGNPRLNQNTGFSPGIGTVVTYSVWLKVGSGTVSVRLGDANWGTSPITVTTSWQRFSVTVTATTGVHANLTINSATADNSSWSIFCWGLQVERSSQVNGYLLTTTLRYASAVSGNQVTFTDPVTATASPPANAAILYWTGNYYYLVRFLDDELEFNQFANGYYECSSCKLVSVT